MTGETTLTPIDTGTGPLELSGARVLVIGLGRSGTAAARLAAGRGARVTVADRRPADAWDEIDARLSGLDVRRVPGEHPPSLLDACDLAILSPGVPASIPLVREAAARGIPVWSEIELAWRHCRGGVIAVTGSNGKSTVTTMIGAILAEAGVRGGVGGNLETPFAELLEHDDEEAIHALELSSFQLETTHTLAARVAVLTNLTPDHMDRYEDLDAYAAAKARLFRMQPGDGLAVLNADDAHFERFAAVAAGRVRRFSTRSADADAWLDGATLRLRDGGALLETAELSVVGEHNVANALAAALACRGAGIDPDAVRRGLRGYRALPHRLERIVLSGTRIEAYDDSKATNPDSALRALAAFPGRRVHWILGGRDKRGDWTGVVDAARGADVRVLLIGEAAAMLEERLSPVAATTVCGTLENAVREAFAGAREGDVLLLAPGCASFDQFRDFRERGERFRAAVRAVAGAGGRDA